MSISVGSMHLEASEEGCRPNATILDGTELVGITSDADKAAALLAFPLARRAWELGYCDDFDVTHVGGEVEMTLSCGRRPVRGLLTRSGSPDGRSGGSTPPPGATLTPHA